MTEHEPYPEPDVANDDYPDEWTPKQRTNWDNHGQPVYENLETDLGRYWYKRCWRPKMRGSGMMKRDHVKFGTEEDYVVYMVNDATDMWADMTGAAMRMIGSYPTPKEQLDDAVTDIVRAKLQRMPPERRARLARDAKQVGELYGLETES